MRGALAGSLLGVQGLEFGHLFQGRFRLKMV